MPPKIKKTYCKKNKENIDANNIETVEENLDKVENIYSRLRKRNIKKEDKLQTQKIDSDEEFEKLLLSPKNQEVIFKPLTFWSKKLKDLEDKKDKKKKCGLYEFSETDESQSPFKKKKEPRKREKTVRKKEKSEIKFANYNKLCSKGAKSRCKTTKEEPKIKKDNPDVKHCMIKEQNKINEEKEVIAKKKDQLTLSTVKTPLRITSTPAINKANILKPSDFMFLSPVVREENAENFEMQNYLSNCSQSNVYKTPKRETKPCSTNKRILRSKKMVI